jgi:hypothetical protein
MSGYGMAAYCATCAFAGFAIDALRRLRSRFCIAVPVDVVWPQFVAVAVIGALFFGLAILRFRAVVAQAV